MQVTFFGAASEIGRSCIMLESNKTRILLDSGVKIGSSEEYPMIPESDLKSIDAILISHAHLDHSAYLPHIFSKGFRGSVYATKPTLELMNILIGDYLKIAEPPEVDPDAFSKMQKSYKITEYNMPTIIKDMEISMLPAGHILGSSMITVKAEKKSILYTGDVNCRNTKLLNKAESRNLESEIMITESTYGGSKDIFPPEKSVLAGMISSIKETISKGGKIIIPSFGVGRAQEVMLLLDDYMKSGAIPAVPIYTDGMVNKALRIHRHNVIYCRDELQKRILMNDDDPFKSRNFAEVGGISGRNKILSQGNPAIIVTTSGMLTGGPVLEYLERLGGDTLNKLILVGYQAEGTRGRALAEGADEIEYKGRKTKISMDIEQYRLSAHADRNQLLNLIQSVKSMHDLFIIHGEPSKSRELGEAVSSSGNPARIHMPSIKDSFGF